MSEFDEYLARIRSALDVSPGRAEEICAEVRTHLEAHAAQLEREGVSREEAVAKAVSSFGAPKQIAQRLAQANRRHAIVGGFRAALAFVLSLGGMVVAFALWEGQFVAFHLFWEPEPWNSLIRNQLETVMMVVVMGPAALLAGMAGGRRWWWLPGTPLALAGLLILATVRGSGIERPLALTMIVAAAPLAAAWGLLGSRVPERCPLWYTTAVLCTAYLALSGVIALYLQVRDPAGVVWGIAIVELGLGAIATGYLWQRGRPWRRLAALATLGCGACALAIHKTLQQGIHYGMGLPDVVVALRAVLIAENLLALLVGVAAFHLWRRRGGSLPPRSVAACGER